MVLVVAGALATVGWYEADKEVRILCGLLTTGMPGAEVSRILGTAELARVRPADADVATASAFTFHAVANLRSSRCAVSLAGAAVAGSAFTRTVRLERVAARRGRGSTQRRRVAQSLDRRGELDWLKG